MYISSIQEQCLFPQFFYLVWVRGMEAVSLSNWAVTQAVFATRWKYAYHKKDCWKNSKTFDVEDIFILTF